MISKKISFSLGKGDSKMQYKLYTDVHEFYKDTYDALMRDEAQNMILLGNIIIGNEGKDKTD